MTEADKIDVAGRKRLFLERRSYQNRRLIDALRLLPVLGALLWLVPLIWTRASTASNAPDAAISVVSASFYIFAVWALLVVLGGILSRRAAPSEQIAPPQSVPTSTQWDS